MREGWRKATLGEVAETRLGKTLPRGSGADVDGQPYLRNVNVQWGRVATEGLNRMVFSSAEQEQLRLRAGDILVCEGGEVGRLALLQEDLDGIFFQNALHRVRVVDQAAFPQFVALALERFVRSGGLDGITTQVTIAHLNQSKLRALPLTLPPLDEQRRIVDLIGALDDTIAAAERQVGLVEEALERARDLIPDASLVPLSEVLTAIESGTSTKPVQGHGPAVNQLTLAAIRPGSFRPGEAKDVGAARLPERARLREGDLLITRSNTPDRVGYVALARDVAPDTFIPDLVWRLVADESMVSKVYLEQMLSSPRYRAAITATASGTSQSMRKINKTNFGAIQVPLPTISEQHDYVRPLVALSAVAQSHGRVVAQLQTLRSNLLTALLSGEHEIPESYDEVMEATA